MSGLDAINRPPLDRPLPADLAGSVDIPLVQGVWGSGDQLQDCSHTKYLLYFSDLKEEQMLIVGLFYLSNSADIVHQPSVSYPQCCVCVKTVLLKKFLKNVSKVS